MIGKQVSVKQRVLGISIVTAIIVFLSSMLIYGSIIKPKKYNEHMILGNKYLIEEKYKEAVLEFEKAIKIESKSTEARLCQAKAYIGNEENDKAVTVLEEAQNIDKTNEDLIKEIIEILKDIDSGKAYEFLDRFVKEVGKDKISQEINDMINSANEYPSEPIVTPVPEKYAKEISVELKLDELKLGHTYYYTVDGSEPNKGSNKYGQKININKTTTIKVIGYNKKDESTNVITLDYVIDESILENIKQSIARGEILINETEVGNKVGNISKSNKEKLQLSIDSAKALLQEKLITYSDANSTKSDIESSIKEFEENIIKPIDKSKLQTQISKAKDLYKNAVEGSGPGKYKLGSKSTLITIVQSSEDVYKKATATQIEVDTQVEIIKKAIKAFKSSKNTMISKTQATKLIEEYFMKNRNFIPNSILIEEIINNQYYHIQVSDYPDGLDYGRTSYGWFYVDIYTGDIYNNTLPPNISN